jgi:hypothetical protein
MGIQGLLRCDIYIVFSSTSQIVGRMPTFVGKLFSGHMVLYCNIAYNVRSVDSEVVYYLFGLIK